MSGTLRNLFIVSSTLLIAACSGSDKITSKEVKEFVNACETSSNMGKELCSCIAEIGQKELTEDQFRFMKAGLDEDDQTEFELRRSMPVQEITEAGMFMVSGPQRCARMHDSK